MKQTLFERVSLADADVRMTNDKYLTAMPRVARTGIQLYRGSEVGMNDKAIVRVYRPEDQVFDKDSLSTFAHKPVTDDHPKELVDASNWKKYAIGTMGGGVARDGEFIRVDLAVMDGAAIQKIKDGKAELSVGYTCEVVHGAGTTPTGEAYDAMQSNIRVNHLALVDTARGGSLLRIGDSGEPVNPAVFFDAFEAISKGMVNHSESLMEASAFLADQAYPIAKDGTVYVSGLKAAKKLAVTNKDSAVETAIDALLQLIDQPKSPVKDAGNEERTTPMKLHTIDGVSVEMSDTAIQVVDRAMKTLNDQIAKLNGDAKIALDTATKFRTDSEASIAKLTTDNATLTAENATLKQQVKDAAITPDKLDAMVKDRSEIGAKAKALLPTLTIDGKSVADIRKEAVMSKLGDAAKDWNDDQIKVSFDTLTNGVKIDTVTVPSGTAPLARALSTNQMGDSAQQREKMYADRDRRIADAWKGPQAAAKQ